jgi:hypothetical protein
MTFLAKNDHEKGSLSAEKGLIPRLAYNKYPRLSP